MDPISVNERMWMEALVSSDNSVLVPCNMRAHSLTSSGFSLHLLGSSFRSPFPGTRFHVSKKKNEGTGILWGQTDGCVPRYLAITSAYRWTTHLLNLEESVLSSSSI
jgi:hypothetical protein